MVVTAFLCDKCVELGVRRLAEFVLLADEVALVGPVDAGEESPLEFLKWRMLCRQHHAQLPDDAGMAYVPLAQAFGDSIQSGS